MTILCKIFLLLVGHALCDYPLQGDFLARGKNHKTPIPGIPWIQCLLWHALIQSGMVFIITKSLWLALAEFAIHAGVDYAKCDGRINFNQDQAIHIICKVLWGIL
jgi:hypothetical protein